MVQKNLNIILLFLALLSIFLLLPQGTVFASTTDGSLSGYAFGNNIGWINFGCSQCNVHVKDAVLTGYAWSDNFGWINLNPTQSGVANDNEGTLSGRAWGEQIGWIDFSGVTINTSGAFLGAASVDNGGSINFACSNCNLQTDWRPLSTRSTGGSGGGGSGGGGSGGGGSGGGGGGRGGSAVVLPPATPSSVTPTVPTPLPLPSPFEIVKKIEDGLNFLLPKIFKPAPSLPLPAPLVAVPEITPLVFQGQWQVLPTRPISLFVLAPLPSDVKILAQKFPQLAQTFAKVGINKITDVAKLKNANLNVPLFADVIGLSPVQINPGQFVAPKSLPLASLSAEIKNKIPSEVVFVKTAGGFVDINTALSIDDRGKANQHIETITGQPLQLIVKVDSLVASVKGYIVFKSKKASPVSVAIPAKALAASLIFANPNLAIPSGPSRQISVEGTNVPSPHAAGNQAAASAIENRLVLSTFDYTDSGDNIYTANIMTPVVDGEYQIITTIQYKNPTLLAKEIKLTTVVDPEGYVFQKTGNQETRIMGAVVSLYWLNPSNKKYENWPARDFQQENPQITDQRGTYSFLVPNGFYYLKVDAPGYESYTGTVFEIKEGSGVHMNIELRSNYWYLQILDWKTVLLIIVIVLLMYNFYRDRLRAKEKK